MTTMFKSVWGRMMVVGSVAVLVLGAGLSIGSLAFAGEDDEQGDTVGDCTGEQRGQRMLANRFEKLADDLDLTGEQQGYLDKVVETLGEGRSERRSQRGSCCTEVLSAIEAGDLDPEEVHAAIDERFVEQQALAHEVANDFMIFVNSLDSEQRQLLIERLDGVSSCVRCRTGCEGDDCHRGAQGCDGQGCKRQGNDGQGCNRQGCDGHRCGGHGRGGK